MKKRTKSLGKRILAAAICVVMMVTVAVPAFAASDPKLPDNLVTYDANGFGMEKISHPTLTDYEGKPDGVVDYVGNGNIAIHDWQNDDPNVQGDRGQSYSYASASYGDWVYINTMYGGLGAANILKIGMGGLGADAAKAFMDTMYNGNLYTGEPDGAYAGGILFKVNVKTGETKLLMSSKLNGLIPTFRGAVTMNNKLYFVGMVLDMKNYPGTPEEMAKDIAMQNAMPCLYEIDPENNDKMTPVYFCVDADGYVKLKANNIFTSTRAVCTFNQDGKDTMIFGGLDADNGAYLLASKDPSAGQDSFKVIATMEDFKNYPAIHRPDVNGGGGIYQVIQYKDRVYVVVCAGKAGEENAQGTKTSFALFRGECNGDPTVKASWTWTEICGDTSKGARYSFGIDPERVSCGACTLQVYGDNLYIGDYNDVSSALQGIALKQNLVTQSTNLKQSINLYRMNEDEDIEMLVGDKTAQFPNGGTTGLGSGYGNYMNQYTWQTMVYEGKMYVGTMDTTTLLEPIAQFVNGDLIHMSKEEWTRLIGYIRTLIQLMLPGNKAEAALFSDNVTEDEARAMVLDAAEKAMSNDKTVVKAAGSFENVLTDEQIDKLVDGILSGEIAKNMLSNKGVISKLVALNAKLVKMTTLIDSKDKEAFAELYCESFDIYEAIRNLLPDSLKGMYDLILKFATKQNIEAALTILRYSKNSVRGFDLYTIEEKEDGSVVVETKTLDGFGDAYNHGLRIFAQTDDYLLIGTANPFYGTQLWRHANSVKGGADPVEPVDPADPVDPSEPVVVTPVGAGEDKNAAAESDKNAEKDKAGNKAIPDTGDSSLALIVLAAACGASGVMLGLKKKKK